MNMKSLSLVGAAIICTLSTSWALDASGQRYSKMLSSGGPGSIRSAAEDIYNTSFTDQEVLDLAAQVLSEFHTRGPDNRDNADTTAWLCKALGNSGSARYRSILEQVSNANIHRRTRGHCETAMDGLPKDATAQFVVGSVTVADYREGGAKQVAGKPAAAPAAANPAAVSNRTVDLSLVKEGMSMQEVDDLLGPPTNQSTRMTGKQFQPFNFAARDTQRTTYFYKGVGRVVFSLRSAYNGVYRVIEIAPDPAETGYP